MPDDPTPTEYYELTEEEETKKYLEKSGLVRFFTKLKTFFQAKLVSGTNIKTINNQSVLGSGNLTIESGGSSTIGYEELYQIAISFAGSVSIDVCQYIDIYDDYLIENNNVYLTSAHKIGRINTGDGSIQLNVRNTTDKIFIFGKASDITEDIESYSGSNVTFLGLRSCYTSVGILNIDGSVYVDNVSVASITYDSILAALEITGFPASANISADWYD